MMCHFCSPRPPEDVELGWFNELVESFGFDPSPALCDPGPPDPEPTHPYAGMSAGEEIAARVAPEVLGHALAVAAAAGLVSNPERERLLARGVPAEHIVTVAGYQPEPTHPLAGIPAVEREITEEVLRPTLEATGVTGAGGYTVEFNRDRITARRPWVAPEALDATQAIPVITLDSL